MSVAISTVGGLHRYSIDGTRRWVAGMNDATTRPVVTAWSDHLGLSLQYLPGAPGFIRRAAEQGTRERGRRRLAEIGGPKGVAELFGATGANCVKMRLDREVNEVLPRLLAIPVALENHDALELLGLEAPEWRALLEAELEARIAQCAGATIIGAQWGNEPLWKWARSGGEEKQDDLIALFMEVSSWWREHMKRRLPGIPTMSPGHAGSVARWYPRLWAVATAQPWDVFCVHNYGRWTASELNGIGAGLGRPILVGEWTKMCPLPKWQNATQMAMRVPKDGASYPTAEDQADRADWVEAHLRDLARQPWVLGECWHSMWDHRGRKWGMNPIDITPDREWIDALGRGRRGAQRFALGGATNG